jgi:hypothetical protein
MRLAMGLDFHAFKSQFRDTGVFLSPAQRKTHESDLPFVKNDLKTGKVRSEKWK